MSVLLHYCLYDMAWNLPFSKSLYTFARINTMLMDITDTPKTPLLGMDLAALGKVAAELGLPRFTAGQMFDWLYRKGIGEIDGRSNI